MADSHARRIFVTCKEAFKHHRQITAFQKIVCASVIVGVLLTVFNTWWFRGFTVAYALSVYGSISVCKYLTQRQKYFSSHLILIFIEKLDDFGVALRKFFAPILVDSGVDKQKVTGNLYKHYDISSTHSQIKQPDEAASSDIRDDQFYDALDENELEKSNSVFYIDLGVSCPQSEAHSTTQQDLLEDAVDNATSDVEHQASTYMVEREGRQTFDSQENAVTIPEELDLLLRFIHRDFVKAWYDLISQDNEVLEEATDIIQGVCNEIQDRFQNIVRIKYYIARDVLLLFRQHVSRVKQARLQYEILYRTMRRRSSRPIVNGEPSSPKRKSVTECFIAKFDLHPALRDDSTQISYLHAVLDILLQNLFLSNLTHSKSLKLVFREILACNVFKNVLNLLSEPEFIHERIVKITSDEEFVVQRRSKQKSASSSCEVKVSESEPTEIHKHDPTNELSQNLWEQRSEKDKKVSDYDTLHPVTGLKPSEDYSQGEQNGSQQLQCNTTDVPVHSLSEQTKIKDNVCNKNNSDSLLQVPGQTKPDSYSKEVKFYSPEGSPVMRYSLSDSELDKDSVKMDSEEDDVVFQGMKSENAEQSNINSPSSESKRSISPNSIADSFKQLLKRSSERVKSARNLEKIEEVDALDIAGVKRSHSSSEILKKGVEDISWSVEGMLTFQEASIPKTEKAKEVNSSAYYTLYIIQYEAVYLLEEGEHVVKTGMVKRRFREFVNLQSCLDSNSEYKKSMKDVKGPRRWLSLPFGNMDKESIENRRTLLENFLKSLIQKEDICNGPELKEFLGYSGDGHIAFVRKSQDTSMPRIDQIARKMSGVLDIFVDKLPSLTQELPKLMRKEEACIENMPLEDADEILVNFVHQEDKDLTLQISKAVDVVIVENHQTDDITDDSDEETEKTVLGTSSLAWQESVMSRTPRVEGDGSDLPDELETQPQKRKTPVSKDPIPLAGALLDVLVELLYGRDNWMCRDKVITTGRLIIGKALHRYLETKIDMLTSGEMTLFYLHTLRETIWPDGALSEDIKGEYSEQDRILLKKQASRCLAEFLPGLLKTLLGEEDFQFIIDEAMETIKYEQLNRHFWFCTLDLLLERLFPEISTDEICDRIFGTSRRKSDMF